MDLCYGFFLSRWSSEDTHMIMGVASAIRHNINECGFGRLELGRSSTWVLASSAYLFQALAEVSFSAVF